MKYIIELEDEPRKELFADAGNYYRCKQRPFWFISEDTRDSLTPYTEPDRKAIEDEVWELVRKIECLTVGETEDCFDVEYDGIPFVANMFSYQEAKSKYEAWKKQKEAICVGDEVKHKQYEWAGFVTNISESGYLTLMWGLGEASKGFDPENFEKTSKHCAEVEELIKKISEAQHNEEE